MECIPSDIMDELLVKDPATNFVTAINTLAMRALNIDLLFLAMDYGRILLRITDITDAEQHRARECF